MSVSNGTLVQRIRDGHRGSERNVALREAYERAPRMQDFDRGPLVDALLEFAFVPYSKRLQTEVVDRELARMVLARCGPVVRLQLFPLLQGDDYDTREQVARILGSIDPIQRDVIDALKTTATAIREPKGAPSGSPAAIYALSKMLRAGRALDRTLPHWFIGLCREGARPVGEIPQYLWTDALRAAIWALRDLPTVLDDSGRKQAIDALKPHLRRHDIDTNAARALAPYGISGIRALEEVRHGANPLNWDLRTCIDELLQEHDRDAPKGLRPA